MNRSHLARAAVAACLALSALSVQAAREVGSARFDEATQVGGQPLVLNGAGMRVKLILKVYAAALYLPRKEASASAALAAPGPKRVELVMMRDVPAQKLTESLMEGIVANTTAADRAPLQARLDELEKAMAAIGEARKGAVVRLDYLPGTGTRFSIGDKPIMRDVPGEDFYRALLKIWLGDKPADGDLRAKLLGAE